MHYQDPHHPFWQESEETPLWAKIAAVAIIIVGAIAAITIYVSRESAESPTTTQTPAKSPTVLRTPMKAPSRTARHKEHHFLVPPATRGVPNGVSAGFLGPQSEASFASLESELGGQVGIAVQPLGGGEMHEFGDLTEGHAWSSIKIPILATLLREHNEALGSEERSWATSAITASDNEAAASLFGRIEEAQGGLQGASQAVEQLLHESGSESTVVATAPPPPGAVSTYGQTEWSLNDAAQFFAALGRCEVLGPSGTQYVISLMEDVIPEQRWGLGEARFPTGWHVAMKGGWGPESGAGGAYLVRQSGIVQNGNRGIAVAMLAMADSGTYPAGASDLTKVAGWLAGELKGLGPSYSDCTA